MKAILLTAIITILLSIGNIHAGNPKGIVYSNDVVSDRGLIRESVLLNEKTSQPLERVIYRYNNEGVMESRVVYKWKTDFGWIAFQKYEYECNRENKVINITFTRWDDKRNAWSNRSKQVLHIYDANGKFLALKQFEINNEMNNLITQR